MTLVILYAIAGETQLEGPNIGGDLGVAAIDNAIRFADDQGYRYKHPELSEAEQRGELLGHFSSLLEPYVDGIYAKTPGLTDAPRGVLGRSWIR